VYDAKNQLVNVTTGVGGPTVVGLGYDVQGNVNNKSGTTYTFDYGNRLRSVGGASPASSYVYDGHGRRVRDLTTGSKYSLYSQTGQLTFASDFRTAKWTNYIYLGGSLVAFSETPHAGGTATVKYQHTDALGTPIAVTDASKAVIETFEYEPFGQLVNSTLKDGPGYTGHVQDASSGLTYMQQRYYDPAIGRFLSVDPVTANSGTGANFNRYTYVGNNPYAFLDPDGRYRCKASKEDCLMVRNSLKKLRQTIRSSRSLRARSQLNKISTFYGEETNDQSDKVIVNSGTGQAPKNDGSGNITGGTVVTSTAGETNVFIDFAAAKKELSKPGWAPGVKLQTLIDGLVVHEGSHGADQQMRFKSGTYPMYRTQADRRWGEVAAYWREAIFWHMSNTDSPWLIWTRASGYDEDRIEQQVNISMDLSDSK
jgi:RHS repeat-associated protein